MKTQILTKEVIMYDVFKELADKMLINGFWFDESNEMLRMEQCYKSEEILMELSKFANGETGKDEFIDTCREIATRKDYWSAMTKGEFEEYKKRSVK